MLAVAIAIAYAQTLHPGVAGGDAAELQFMAPLLGVCHPPGYPFIVLAARGFSALPLGGSIAWRINLMMAVCAGAACVLASCVVQRVTGRALTGLVAGATLAFSSIFWMHALVAEVYAFYTLLLTAGFYAAVRFAAGGRAAWLYAAAGLLGLCVSNRPSEVFVLPALAGLWWPVRRQVHIGWRRLALCLALGVAPLGLTVAYFIVRQNPAALYQRDDELRDGLLRPDPKLYYAYGERIVDPVRFDELGAGEKVRYALSYSLGLKWAGRARELTWEDFFWDLEKLGWMLSGLGMIRERFDPNNPETQLKRLEQYSGGSIGLGGLALAVCGVVLGWRRWRPGVLLGVLATLGNITFYLIHSPPDNLEFISPGLLGLALLAGMGAAGWARERPTWPLRLFQAASVLVPAVLLGNLRWVDCSTPTEQQRQAELARVLEAPLPPESIVLAKYDEAMTFRYVLYLEGGRTDLNVVILRSRYESAHLRTLIRRLRETGRPLVAHERALEPSEREFFGPRTPPKLLALRFYVVN